MIPRYLTDNSNNFILDISIHEISSAVVPHGHSFLEFHYVFEGQGIEKINGVQHEMKPGTLAIIFPHQIHEMYIPNGARVSLYNLCLSANTLFDQDEYGVVINKLLFDMGLNPETIYNLDENTSQKIIKILTEIHEDFNNEKVWKSFMLKAKVIELFIEFDRYRRSSNQTDIENPQSTNKNDAWSIIRFVYSNWNSNISLESLSKQFYLSTPYISTIFKKCLGTSFHIFLRDLRIENACSLLTSSKMSIADIAYEVGYSSYSTFIRVFHNKKGVSPSEYRQKAN